MVIGNQVRHIPLVQSSISVFCFNIERCKVLDNYCLYLILQKQVRTQQIHEMKKKEKEYIKLQVGSCLVIYLLII